MEQEGLLQKTSTEVTEGKEEKKGVIKGLNALKKAEEVKT